jgi:hypothetical protein
MKQSRFVAGLVLAATVVVSTVASAQENYIERVNAPFAVISPSKRSDSILLPALAKMDAPPKAVATPEQAALLPATSPDFSSAAAWAQAPSQRAVLDALDRVTKETDWKAAMAFGQPYGAEGATPELIQAKLYTELGDPPMLAGAQHLYMPALDKLVVLANVEATRLAAEGKPSEAIDLLIDLLFFERQIADRQFFEEIEWAFTRIAATYERVRDIAFQDLKGSKQIEFNRIPDQIKRLSEENLGYMDLERVRFPLGNRAAAEQIVARVYNERGQMNETVFAATMSRLGSTDRRLRLFAETARWRQVAGSQAGGYEAIDKVKAVYDDFARRWVAPYFDSGRLLVSEYAKLNRAAHAAIDVTTPDFTRLIELRQMAKVEAAGTRMMLGLTAFTLANGRRPPVITAVRPQWMPQIEVDWYDLSVRQRARPPFEYVLPMQAPVNEREEARPHELEVYTANGETNFKVNLLDDVFLLYSKGTDNANNGGVRVQNTWKVVQGADYLISPPVISLYRQYLIDRGDLKVQD